MSRFTFTLVLVFFALAASVMPPAFSSEESSVLVVSGWALNRFIDDTYKQKMEAEGYRMDSCRFQELTWERMKQFNVLVIERVPMMSEAANVESYKAAFPLLKKFLDQGGGILLFSDPFHSETHSVMNLLTKDYGLEMLDEYVTDPNPKHRFQQQHFLQKQFFTTRQITDHPTTRGISELMLPDLPYAPNPFIVDSNWKVLVTGEDSAYSSNPWTTKASSFKTRPPLFAVRDTPKARMAMFPVMSTWTVQAGYHEIWQGLVLDKGNVYTLLKNTYDWLGQPSMKSQSLGGFDGKSIASAIREEDRYNPFRMDYQTAPKHLYRGLIGAHSNIIEGRDSVADLCAAARKLGLNFLAFTEPMTKMNKVLWQKLATECARESYGDFVALPGFEYTEINDNTHRIVFGNKDWLPDYCLTKEGLPNYPNRPLFDLDYPTVAFIDSHHPYSTGSIYHNIRLYIDFGLFTYDGTRLVDDSADRFKTLTQDTYNIKPLTYHKMDSVADLVAVAKSDTYKTWAMAPSIKEVPEAMQCQRELQQQFFGNSCFVTNGPLIKDFRLVGKNGTIDRWESYWLFEAGDKARVWIDVASDSPITDIVVYNGPDVWWHFRPSAKEFNIKLPYALYTRWKPVDGGQGLKTAEGVFLLDNDSPQYLVEHGVTDLNNIYQYGYYPTDKGGILFRGGRRAVRGGMGMHWYGSNIRTTSPISTRELTPDGLDIIYGGSTLDTSSTVWVDNRAVNPQEIRHTFAHASGNVSVLDSYGDTMAHLNGDVMFAAVYHWLPAKDIVFTSRNITSPCRPDGYSVIELDQKITFLRDLTTSGAGKGLPISFLSVRIDKKLFPKVSLDSGGKIERFDNGEAPITARLDKFGGVYFYPQYFGSGCVVSLDPNQYDVKVRDGNLYVGLDEPGRAFKKGETLRARFLVINDSGENPDDAGLRALVASYGVGGKPAYKLSAPARVIPDYSPVVLASNNAVDFKVGKAQLANDLVVRVKGLEPNWSAARYDACGKKLELLDVFERTAYVSVDTRAKDTSLFVGNVLTCGSANVKLTLVDWSPKAAVFQAHNLSDKPVSTVVNSAGARAGLPGVQSPRFAKTWTVDHGKS